MASKELIRRVAEASDIVSVIGAYVQLTRAGSEYRALSPFTTERTPSF
jgi:DNA primase